MAALAPEFPGKRKARQTEVHRALGGFLTYYDLFAPLRQGLPDRLLL